MENPTIEAIKNQILVIGQTDAPVKKEQPLDFNYWPLLILSAAIAGLFVLGRKRKPTDFSGGLPKLRYPSDTTTNFLEMWISTEYDKKKQKHAVVGYAYLYGREKYARGYTPKNVIRTLKKELDKTWENLVLIGMENSDFYHYGEGDFKEMDITFDWFLSLTDKEIKREFERYELEQ